MYEVINNYGKGEVVYTNKHKDTCIDWIINEANNINSELSFFHINKTKMSKVKK